MPNIGNHVDAIFLPESVNTSTTLRITGGDLIVNTDDLVVDESTSSVGIGTTNPTSPLTVMSSSNPEIRFGYNESQDHRITWDSSKVFLEADPENVNGSSALGFKVDGSEALYITSTGNIGIGTNSPNRLQHLLTSADTHLRIQSTSASGNNEAAIELIRGSNQSAIKNKAGGIEFCVQGLTNEVARIDWLGKLLVGPNTTNSLAGLTANVQSESGSNSGGLIGWCNANSYFGGYLALGKSRGDAIGSVTSVQNNDNLGTIYFFGADGTDRSSWGAQIDAGVDGTPGSNDMPGRLVFSTTADGASSPTERMRIDSSGNIGIGTTSPQQRLHLKASNGQPIIRFQRTGGPGGYSELRAGTGFAFFNNTSEAMRIDSLGNVGIGTNNPTSTLHIEGHHVSLINRNNTNNTYFFAQNTGLGNAGVKMKNSQGEWTIIASDRLRFIDDDSSAERLSINSSGYVGIGTTSPSNTLTVKGAVGSNQGIDVIHSNGNTVARLIHGGTGDEGQLILLDSNSTTVSIRGETGVSSYFNAGNVGIGTTNPQALLQVGSRTAASPAGQIDVVRGETISGGTGPIIKLIHGPDAGTQRTHSIYSYIGDLRIVADPNENMELHTGGSLSQIISSTGNVGIGTNSPTDRLDVNGSVYIANRGSADSVLRIDSDAAGNYDPVFDMGSGQNAIDFEGFQIWYDNSVGDVHLATTYNHSNSAIRFHTGTGVNKVATGTKERLTITGDGNVGIGTNNPHKKLEALASSDDDYVTIGATSIASSRWAGIHFGYRENNTAYRKSMLVFERKDNAARGTVHILNNNQNGVDSATLADSRFSITSAGEVTKPYNPFFNAIKNQHYTFTSGQRTTIANWTNINQYGNHFNLTTGVFTAPVAGVYYVYVSTMTARQDNGDFQISIHKNGTMLVNSNDLHDSATTTYMQTTVPAFIKCAANDTIEFRGYNSSGTSSYIYSGAYTHCGGYLIG